MKRGPIIHGALLLVALIFAYQTWTREDKVEPKTGDIAVWRLPEGSITSVVYESKQKTVRMDKRTDAGQTYWWGTETKNITRKDETETQTREFAIGAKGEEVVGFLTELNALRAMTDLSEDKLDEYGLNNSDANLTVTYEGGSKTLVVGSKVFSGKDRFVRDVETGDAYALAGVVVSPLMEGETALQLREFNGFDDEELARVVVTADGQSRELLRITVDAEGHEGVAARKTWADARTPDKADQTMANFLTRVKGLRVESYEPEARVDGMRLMVRLEYKAEDGRDLGWFELYEQSVMPEPEPTPTPGQEDGTPDANPDANQAENDAAAKDPAAKDPAAKDTAAPESGEPAAPEAKPEPEPVISYYMRTELTRVPAKLAQGGATRLADDIAQVFDQSASE